MEGIGWRTQTKNKGQKGAFYPRLHPSQVRFLCLLWIYFHVLFVCVYVEKEGREREGWGKEEGEGEEGKQQNKKKKYLQDGEGLEKNCIERNDV